MLESKEWLQARWFKSSYSCGKYEQGKWRRNNCFPENHQDDLEQCIYPSIYPQTAPLELFGGQLQKPGSTGSFNRGKRVHMCLSTCSEGQQGALLRIMHRRMMKAGDVCYFLLTRWLQCTYYSYSPKIFVSFSWKTPQIWSVKKKRSQQWVQGVQIQ